MAATADGDALSKEPAGIFASAEIKISGTQWNLLMSTQQQKESPVQGSPAFSWQTAEMLADDTTQTQTSVRSPTWHPLRSCYRLLGFLLYSSSLHASGSCASAPGFRRLSNERAGHGAGEAAGSCDRTLPLAACQDAERVFYGDESVRRATRENQFFSCCKRGVRLH